MLNGKTDKSECENSCGKVKVNFCFCFFRKIRIYVNSVAFAFYNTDNCAYCRINNGTVFAVFYSRVSRIVKIGMFMDRYPAELSGGQQQRVAIARAISTRPPIIMADEPTGALDSKTGHEVLQFLQQLNKEGSTVILITHDNGIAATARRCVRLADGKIVDDRQQEVDWL